jgi:hypothetical protein
VGFFCQNYFSDDFSETIFQPMVVYKLNEKLAIGIGEMNAQYNWNSSQWVVAPLGIGMDYIADIFGQKLAFFANPQYNFERDSASSGWTVYVGVILLVPYYKNRESRNRN